MATIALVIQATGAAAARTIPLGRHGPHGRSGLVRRRCHATRRFYELIPSVGLLLVLAIVLTVMPVSRLAQAQGGGPFSLTWSAFGGGGGISAGGDFSLSATAGLPDAGQLSGGTFTVSGGFWQCTLIGDFSGNGLIDIGDIVAAADHWQAIGASPFDLDGDGLVTVRDVMLVASSFGQAC